MSSTLDDLFQQIIQSEQRAQQRKNHLNEVKTEIENYQTKTNEIDEEIGSLEGQVVLKTQQLNNEELKLKWLTTREMILKDQVKKFTTEKKTLLEEIRELCEKLSSERDTFCTQVDKFTSGFGLLETGQASREQEARDKITSLLQEKSRLETDLQNYNEQKAVIIALDEKRNITRCRLEALQKEEKDLESQLIESKQKVEVLEKKKRQVTDVPLTDQEFIKLQKELEVAKEENLEIKCKDLQQELQDLQQRLWQRQLHHQRGTSSGRPRRGGPEGKPQITIPPDSRSPAENKSNILKVTNYSRPEVRKPPVIRESTLPGVLSIHTQTHSKNHRLEIPEDVLEGIFCEDFTSMEDSGKSNLRETNYQQNQ